MSDTDARISKTTRQSWTGVGNFGITIRSNPYRPAFDTTPERTAATSGGDSR